MSEKLRELSEKATPGEWMVYESLIGSKGTDGYVAKIVANMFQPALDRAKADAPFIVACVNYVRAQLSAGEGTPSTAPMTVTFTTVDSESAAHLIEALQKAGYEVPPAPSAPEPATAREYKASGEPIRDPRAPTSPAATRKMLGAEELGNGNAHFGIHDGDNFCQMYGCEVYTPPADGFEEQAERLMMNAEYKPVEETIFLITAELRRVAAEARLAEAEKWWGNWNVADEIRSFVPWAKARLAALAPKGATKP